MNRITPVTIPGPIFKIHFNSAEVYYKRQIANLQDNEHPLQSPPRSPNTIILPQINLNHPKKKLLFCQENKFCASFFPQYIHFPLSAATGTSTILSDIHKIHLKRVNLYQSELLEGRSLFYLLRFH